MSIQPPQMYTNRRTRGLAQTLTDGSMDKRMHARKQNLYDRPKNTISQPQQQNKANPSSTFYILQLHFQQILQCCLFSKSFLDLIDFHSDPTFQCKSVYMAEI